MAQLKNTIILGDLSVTGAAHLAKTYTNILNVPTTSGGTTYGPGTNGQALLSNGTSVYWGTAPAASTAEALTTDAGSTTQPIYFSGGKPTATQFALKATVNNGTASRIAYYSGANAISSGSIVTDGGYLGSVSYLTINAAHQTTNRLYVNGSAMIGAASSASNHNLIINGKVVINPSYNTSNSYNEGIRINQASNGWANINFGGAADSTSGTQDGQWLMGRRGAAGSSVGAVGDFSIEEQGSAGQGLTIHKDNGGVTLYTTKATVKPSFTIINTTTPSSGSYLYGVAITDNNMVAGSNYINIFGKAISKGNIGYIGYQWAGSDNNDNFVTIGHHSYDHLLKVYQNGRVQITNHNGFASFDNNYGLRIGPNDNTHLDFGYDGIQGLNANSTAASNIYLQYAGGDIQHGRAGVASHLTSYGNITPGTHLAYNLGAATYAWQLLYVARNRFLNSSAPENGEAVLTALGLKTGYPVYTDPEFASGTNSCNVYNNSGGTHVTVTQQDDANCGNSTGKVLRIQHTGTTASPGRGGFVQGITSRKNAVFVQIFRAKIPTGYTIELASNNMGTSYSDQWITDNVGTGKWEWYARRVICGKEGSFSNGGHVYLSGGTAPTSDAPINWYLSYCQLYDLTKAQYDGLRTRESDAVHDYNSGELTTFGYSTSGMSSTSWLGSWDGYKLRAITPINAIKSGLGTSAIGSATQPVYWTGSVFSATTYTLSATINSGTQYHAAYYSGTNAISSASNIYMTSNNLGVNVTSITSPKLIWNLAGTQSTLSTVFQVTGGSYFNGTIVIPANQRAIEFRPDYASYASYIYYGTSGNEALNFVNKQSVTSFVFWTGNSVNSASQWYLQEDNSTARTDNPAVQIKQNCLYINKLIPSGTNAAYNLYVNGISYFNGNTTVNGNMIFPAANIFDWNDGTYRQRLTITDDSTADTAVFTFAQSSDSGSNYTDLLTIRDNGKLMLTTNTGGIYQLITSATNKPLLQVSNNNFDCSILRIDGNNRTSHVETQSYGFDLKYIGTGGGEGNSLRLIADNSGGTDVTAFEISNSGKIGIGATFNTSYQLYVNGTSWIKGNLWVRHLYPEADNTYTIGKSDYRWKHIFFSGAIRRSSRIYPYIASGERSQWYKITFPYSTVSNSSNNWFMLSFDLHFGGGYNANATGVAHIAFYYTKNTSNVWTLSQGSAKCDGILMDKITFYYRTAEPGILYVSNASNQYNGIWIDNLFCDDTAPNYDWTTTTITAVSAITDSTDPALSAYTKLPTVRTYANNGSTYYIGNNTLPNANNTYNLGSSDYKWANIYATTFTGALSGNATTCTYPLGFSSRSTNATWGNQTGATVTCWNESDGGSIDFRKNNPSSGKLSIKVDGRFYGNEGTYPAMLMSDPNSTGYWGMGNPDAAGDVWIRTTSQGIIPYQSGGASAGHSGLGTSSWYFASAYVQNYYGGGANITSLNASNLASGTIANARLPERLQEYHTTANNDTTACGWYYGTSGSPFTKYHSSAADFMVWTHGYSSAWASELATDFRSNRFAVRNKNNGTWSNWNELASNDSIANKYVWTSTMYYDAVNDRFTDTRATNSWGTQIYSKVGYSDGCYISFRLEDATHYRMIGLNSDPTTDTNYTSIDYCWYAQGDGKLNIYESGSSIASITGHTTYAAGDDFRIEYINGYVKYYHNGVLCRSVKRDISGKLFLDSSFYNASNVQHLEFGPLSITPGYTVEYIVGTQTAATGSWTGVTKDVALYPGKMIAYRLPFAGSGNATLNLTLSGGGTTGAINVYITGDSRLTTHYGVNSIIFLTYDGTYWRGSDYWSDSTGYYILTNGFRLVAGGTYKVWRYSLFARLANGTYESFTTSSGTGTKAKNTHGFVPDGKIYWNSANSDYSGTTSFSPYEQYHSIDYRYTFNISTTGIPASAYTYIKWTYNAADGLLYLADTWFATALPTTEDGFIYQRIGSNYYNSADYRGSLLLNNPYYIYKGSNVQLWTPGNVTISAIDTSATFYYPTMYTDASGTGVTLKSSDCFRFGTEGTEGKKHKLIIGKAQSGESSVLYLFKDSNSVSLAPSTSTSQALSFYLPATGGTLALSDHTHTLSIASDSGTNQLTLAHGTKYKLTAGGSTFIFTMPSSGNTDTKVSTAAVTSGTTYYPVVGADTTSAATKFYDKTGFAYKGTNGTTSTVGSAILTLGNSTASGTANNKQGQVVLYGSTSYATTITPGAPTAARTITLPNTTGTVALEGNMTALWTGSQSSGGSAITITNAMTTYSSFIFVFKPDGLYDFNVSMIIPKAYISEQTAFPYADYSTDYIVSSVSKSGNNLVVSYYSGVGRLVGIYGIK